MANDKEKPVAGDEEKKVANKRTTITSIYLYKEDRAKLKLMAKERMCTQSHLLRTAFSFWLANGRPEVEADFHLHCVAKIKQS